MPCPTTTAALYLPPHYLPPSSPTDVFNSAPQTELQQLGFGFFALTASLAHISRTRLPTTATALYTPLQHLPAPSPAASSNGAPKTEPQRLGSFLLLLLLLFLSPNMFNCTILA